MEGLNFHLLIFDCEMHVDNKTEELLKDRDDNPGGIDLGWLPVFPHVLTASMANFLFGYHIG